MWSALGAQRGREREREGGREKEKERGREKEKEREREREKENIYRCRHLYILKKIMTYIYIAFFRICYLCVVSSGRRATRGETHEV